LAQKYIVVKSGLNNEIEDDLVNTASQASLLSLLNIKTAPNSYVWIDDR
jgi:hypothetical protein